MTTNKRGYDPTKRVQRSTDERILWLWTEGKKQLDIIANLNMIGVKPPRGDEEWTVAGVNRALARRGIMISKDGLTEETRDAITAHIRELTNQGLSRKQICEVLEDSAAPVPEFRRWYPTPEAPTPPAPETARWTPAMVGKIQRRIEQEPQMAEAREIILSMAREKKDPNQIGNELLRRGIPPRDKTKKRWSKTSIMKVIQEAKAKGQF